MPASINITAVGSAGTHTVTKVNVNAEDNYIYFKETVPNVDYTSTIPSALNNGTGYIYGAGVGSIEGLTTGDLVFADILSPTQVAFDSDLVGTEVDLTGSNAGIVTLNTPVVYDNRLNIDSSTATNQAVKYFTNGDPLTGLTSGSTYFLKNVSVSDFAGQQSLYTITDVAAPVGQQDYTSSGTFSWTAPAGVYEVSVVAVGGGGGGAQGNNAGSGAGGGGLGWRKSIPVVPGQAYTVVVGAGGTFGTNGGNGGQSYFISPEVVSGNGGLGAVSNSTQTRAGGTFTGDGGGNGGIGGSRRSNDSAGGGGGAGGYSGNGGQGGGAQGNSGNGSGGGGGGGGFAGAADTAGAGGGVGLLGEGASGLAGANSNTDGKGGQGGSGGGNASYYANNTADVYNSTNKAFPGAYGGGASCADNTGSESAPGGGGAVRIIWGEGRYYPSTRTANE